MACSFIKMNMGHVFVKGGDRKMDYIQRSSNRKDKKNRSTDTRRFDHWRVTKLQVEFDHSVAVCVSPWWLIYRTHSTQNWLVKLKCHFTVFESEFYLHAASKYNSASVNFTDSFRSETFGALLAPLRGSRVQKRTATKWSTYWHL